MFSRFVSDAALSVSMLFGREKGQDPDGKL